MRMIDADALMQDIEKYHLSDGKFQHWVEVQPTIEERKTGKWIEKHHAYSDEEKVIEEWQSCQCSVCGRYDTRPYMYYFDEPHFCSWCGADMRGDKQ